MIPSQEVSSNHVHRGPANLIQHLVIVCFAFWHLSVAQAQTPDEPLVQREEPGIIITSLLVPASAEEVRAVLDDPVTFSGFTPDVLSMRVEPRGRCKLLSFQSRGLLEPMRYSTLRCPSDLGWRETLFQSDDFTRYDADIALEDAPGGTLITYKLSVGLDLPVPDVVISRNVKRSAKLTMQAVRDLLARPDQPQPPSAEAPSAEAPDDEH
jgi:hypothetical protein